jgi:Cu2+-exporting ATPase
VTDCTLCGLETPESPVCDDDVSGSFCCRGCLEVARTLDDPAETDAETARESVAGGAEPVADAAADPPDGEEAYLSVDGMHCASCEAFLEGRADGCAGVAAADANYPASAMRVWHDPETTDLDTVAETVGGVGYDARPLRDATDSETDGDDSVAGDGTPTAGPQSATADDSETLGRILVGGFFGMMVMLWYVLFLYPTYFGLPSDTLLFDIRGDAGAFLLGNVWVSATVVLGYTGAPLLRGAYVAVRTRRPNMDVLVSLAAVTAYLYSTVALLVGRVEVYFDVTVVVVVAVTVGSYYERRMRRRAVGKLTDLTRERITEARVRRDDGTETVPTDAVEDGAEVVVRPSERVPLDGEIVEGRAAVDESLVTGESVPVQREPGDAVRGGTLVTDGRLVIEADADGERTLDRVVSLLWDARGDGNRPQRLADALATVFVPVVLLLGVVAFLTHLLLGASPTDALLTGLAVLVVSCPCALGLATPLAVAAGTRELLESGVVLADDSAVEAAADVDVVAFDKTGTLTTGEMRVSEIVTAESVTEDIVLGRAAAVESHSDHPVADAVVEATREQSESLDTTVEDFETHPGNGVSGTLEDGTRVTVGDSSLFEEDSISEALQTVFDRAEKGGELAVFVGWSEGSAVGERSKPTVRGVLVASDDHREGWQEAVASIAAGTELGADPEAEREGAKAADPEATDGRRVVVLTGDSGAAADRIRAADGVDEVYEGLPPAAKSEVVSRLRENGTVAMVGDGSNDAPALAAADVGIAVATGTELAADAADAVLLQPDLSAVETTLSTLVATRRRIRENLVWAFGYNAVAVPAAVLGVVTPLLAAVAMAASSLLVVTNSTRSLGTPVGSTDESETESSRDRELERTAAGNQSGALADGGPEPDTSPEQTREVTES